MCWDRQRARIVPLQILSFLNKTVTEIGFINPNCKFDLTEMNTTYIQSSQLLSLANPLVRIRSLISRYRALKNLHYRFKIIIAGSSEL